jgi:hypothetical protein
MMSNALIFWAWEFVLDPSCGSSLHRESKFEMGGNLFVEDGCFINVGFVMRDQVQRYTFNIPLGLSND